MALRCTHTLTWRRGQHRNAGGPFWNWELRESIGRRMGDSDCSLAGPSIIATWNQKEVNAGAPECAHPLPLRLILKHLSR